MGCLLPTALLLRRAFGSSRAAEATLAALPLRSEREQILTLLDSVKLKTLKPGNPKRRVKILAADKGYDSKEKRSALRSRGIRPQFPKRSYKTKKNKGRPIKISVPRFKQERCFARASKKISSPCRQVGTPKS